jgi:hypothetical protein
MRNTQETPKKLQRIDTTRSLLFQVSQRDADKKKALPPLPRLRTKSRQSPHPISSEPDEIIFDRSKTQPEDINLMITETQPEDINLLK